MSEQVTAVIGEDGWMSPAEPPDTDRTVQIAWEDLSYGPHSLGFYDGISAIPGGTRFWWENRPGRAFRQITDASAVGAWREIQRKATNE